MSSAHALTGAIVRVMPASSALSHIQDLHAKSLGVSTPDHRPDPVALGDLSDAICAVLGQIAAGDARSSDVLLASTLTAARRRGLDGLESILLSAFLSALRGGLTATVGNAAEIWGTLPFPDRLAGGARRVPIIDAGRLGIGSVTAAEVSFAVEASGGSVFALRERILHFTNAAPDTEDDGSEDDPTLGAVAGAIADACAAAVTARAVLDGLGDGGTLAADLADVLDLASAGWRGPSAQLLSGKAFAVAVGVARAADGEDTAPMVALPAGLAPRGRRGTRAIASSDLGGSRLVPARVTAELPTWLDVAGRTAQLNPPQTLYPAAPPSVSGNRGDGLGFTVGNPAITLPTVDQVAFLHIPDALLGVDVNPLTGQPVHPPDVAEAILTEAHTLGVDRQSTTVAELVSRLMSSPG